MDKGLFPKAFCKIVPDFFKWKRRLLHHNACRWSWKKSALAYMYWKETGDLSVWKGNKAMDAIAMNLDDLLCVGAIDKIMLSSTIGRNKNFY